MNPENAVAAAVPVARLVLESELTIRHAETLHARLCEALAAGQGIEIDCRKAPQADLCFVQMLLAARRSAAASGKTCRMVQPLPPSLTQVLLQAGILHDDGSFADPSSSWLKD
ncbi:STAS domain-containing protein [Paracraurococcus lichenis]|uniref:STAS domain-containing protein n=1 Tax=Paracraurococcus lichenis TaxID=3064888 RepID=A0ABT9E467_9PROT|nr:STAS domain-containing protein [Paracraurococcus sp. LOR1-02]MDO9710933.1 STAS domain-containing protein [Paracraurococcus sp. LOR1-02]